MQIVKYLYTSEHKIFGELKYTSEISSDYTKHFHTQLGLALIEQGQLNISYEKDNQYSLEKHSIAFFNPYQVHCTTVSNAKGYYILFLDTAWCSSLQKDFYFETNILHDETLYSTLYSLFQTILHQGVVMSVEEELRTIMKNMFKHYTSKNTQQKSQTVLDIKSYIDRNSATTLSIDDLASYVGYNKSYLIRFFKKEVGLTPQQYILNIKVNKAKELLTYANKESLTSISLDTGFFDQSHFNRNFKGLFGSTPKHYKKVNIVQDK